MIRHTFLHALRQLMHSKARFVTALAGVGVAVMLMLVQLGIRDAAYVSALSIPLRLDAEVVMLSPKTVTLQRPVPFSRRVAARALSLPRVKSITPIYLDNAQWKNPQTHQENPIRVFGFDVERNPLQFPMTFDPKALTRLADQVIFDETSRPRYGPVRETLREKGRFAVELNGRRVDVIGQTQVGVAFEADGNLFTGEANFLRIFPNRQVGAIDLAAVQLRASADPNVVAPQIAALLGNEVQVLTREGFLELERKYLSESAPVDFIFLLGAAVGLFVGGVVIYQILYTDVMNNLPQYATLKAMGFSDNYLLLIVINACLIMAFAGFVPGFLASVWIYNVAAQVTFLPIEVTLKRSLLVLFLTAFMCCASAIIVLQKLRRADPADVF
jgi:putative ABC transport system permease protein